MLTPIWLPDVFLLFSPDSPATSPLRSESKEDLPVPGGGVSVPGNACFFWGWDEASPVEEILGANWSSGKKSEEEKVRDVGLRSFWLVVVSSGGGIGRIEREPLR